MLQTKTTCRIAALVILSGALVLMRGGLFAQSLDIEAAKKEGRVAVYGTTVPNVMTPIHTAFEKRYG
ncbi:MAG TPA: hypothetical protein VFQ89_10540, partial [Candidatus Binatia bacterium]|nr:hypothetical protein [Candidatus Binatia bacterium]